MADLIQWFFGSAVGGSLLAITLYTTKKFYETNIEGEIKNIKDYSKAAEINVNKAREELSILQHKVNKIENDLVIGLKETREAHYKQIQETHVQMQTLVSVAGQNVADQFEQAESIFVSEASFKEIMKNTDAQMQKLVAIARHLQTRQNNIETQITKLSPGSVLVTTKKGQE